MSADAPLLREFVRTGSEAAFAELVRRHVDLVYATARRQLRGDAHAAEDVTQVTFGELLRRAPGLVHHPSLAGWLHRTAMHIASRMQRSEQRRMLRETRAHAMSDLLPNDPGDALWNEIRPVIDASLQTLPERDREMVLLRYLQGRSYAEIAQTFGLSDNTARMRVERALERLRKTLQKHGVQSTAALIAGSVGAHALTPAPPMLVAALTPTALGTSAAGGSLAASLWLARMGDMLIGAKYWVLSGAAVAFTLALAPDLTSRAAPPVQPLRVQFTETSNAPGALATATPAPAAPWTWASVESADYRQLIANLRASGAPEPLIRNFVGLELHRLYAARFAALRQPVPPTPFWRKQPAGVTVGTEDQARLKELERERHAVMQSLFGPDVGRNEAWFLAFAVPDFDAIQFAWLPEDLQSKAQAVLQSVLDQEREENSKPGTRRVDPDAEQERLERKIALLRPLLTPEQLEEFRWRTDTKAEQARSLTRLCNLSAEDFQKLVQRDDPQLFRPAASLSDQRHLEAAAARVINPEKVRDFVRGRDLTYTYAIQVTRDLGLPRDVAERVWEIKQEAMASSEALDALTHLAPEDRARQRRELVDATERSMRGLVGDEGFRALRVDWPWWKNLEKPGSVPSNWRNR